MSTFSPGPDPTVEHFEPDVGSVGLHTVQHVAELITRAPFDMRRDDIAPVAGRHALEAPAWAVGSNDLRVDAALQRADNSPHGLA